jgi:hypothetical protein
LSACALTAAAISTAPLKRRPRRILPASPFDVSVAVEWNPIRSMAVVLGVPALLILIAP